MNKLFYLSSDPGSGKTHWIAKRLRRNQQRKEVITVYAAPSRQLLQEVEAKVPKSIKIDGTVYPSHVVKHIHKELKHARLGDVILITHAAFVKLQKFYQPENIEIIIDETMDLICEFDSRKLVRSLDWFLSIVDLKQSKDPNFERYKQLKIKPAKIKEVKRYIRSEDQDQAISIDETKQLLKYILDDRYKVLLSGTDKNVYVIVTLIDTAVFKIFKRSIFSSAFIESTEMFHLLLRDYQMLSVEHKVKLRDIRHQYSNVVIHPLFNRNRVFSKNQRDNCIVVPKEHKESLETNFSKNGKFSIEKLKKFQRQTRISSKGVDKKLIQATESIRGMLDHFYAVIRTSPNFGENTLVVVNKDVESYRPPVGLLIPPKSHGLNCYSTFTRLAFFAALNPNKRRLAFYRSVIPDYDPIYDWLINTLAQSVTRTAVRNPNNEQKIHVLVPDLTSAKLLKKKLYGMPSIKKLKEASDYAVLGIKDTLSAREKEERQKQAKKRYQDKNKDEIKAYKKTTEYQQRNKEYQQRYRERHREERREHLRNYMREYRKRLKEQSK
jgi:hypothetical protein